MNLNDYMRTKKFLENHTSSMPTDKCISAATGGALGGAVVGAAAGVAACGGNAVCVGRMVSAGASHGARDAYISCKGESGGGVSGKGCVIS